MYGIWRVTSPGLSFFYGWLWGTGFWLGQVFWLAESLYVQPQRFGWLFPFFFIGIPTLFALYFGICAWTSSKIRQKYPYMTATQYAVCFGLLWNLREVAQGHLFTGFPWNLTAYIWHHCPEMMQGAAYVGSYGLGLCTVLLFLFPLGFFLKRSTSFLRAMRGYYCCGAILCGMYFLGSYRLREKSTFHQGLFFRLVQPCIFQKDKINPALAKQHFRLLVQLSRRPSSRMVTHVLWPESAVPWAFTADDMKNFPDLVGNAILLTGVCYLDDNVWNSLLMKRPGILGEIVYHKQHLIPLGEYIPCRKFLESFLPASWIQKITPGKRDFSHGYTSCHSTIIVDDFSEMPSFRPFICYESIFPSTVSAPHKKRPQWIFVLTNDAWFGDSPGPHQHFVSAQFRSVEEGLPLLRVANTGISAVIDPWGRVLRSLPLNTMGCIDTELPQALLPTIYSRFGIFLWGILWSICSIGLFFRVRQKRRLHEQQ